MSLNYPQLYAVGVHNTFFSRFVFLLTIVEGVFSAVIIYFIPYCTMRYAVQPDGRGLVDHKTFGVVVESALTVAVTLRVGNLCVGNYSRRQVKNCMQLEPCFAKWKLFMLQRATCKYLTVD